VSDFDLLRIPSPLDPTAPAYKDWFHLNLFDHRSGAMGLINLSLHGAPADRRARAVGTALFHVADKTWRGNVEITGIDTATVLPHGVALHRSAMLVDPARSVLHASVDMPGEGVAARLRCEVAARPIRIELGQPFGSGWIAWFVAPRVTLSGWLTIDGIGQDLEQWSGYHDHNWGRWFWGEDFGWEWGAFAAPPPGPIFVLARLTDRLHAVRGPAQLIVVEGRQTRIFQAGSVDVRYAGRSPRPARRLPGALAALHGDRAEPVLPGAVEVEAVAGLDWIRLRFEANGVAQLIEGDPMRPGYSFIHELAGSFTAEGRLRGADASAAGTGVFEHVG
jgi:hypothetical protein